LWFCCVTNCNLQLKACCLWSVFSQIRLHANNAIKKKYAQLRHTYYVPLLIVMILFSTYCLVSCKNVIKMYTSNKLCVIWCIKDQPPAFWWWPWRSGSRSISRQWVWTLCGGAISPKKMLAKDFKKREHIYCQYNADKFQQKDSHCFNEHAVNLINYIDMQCRQCNIWDWVSLPKMILRYKESYEQWQ